MYQMNPLEAKSHGYMDFNFGSCCQSIYTLYTCTLSPIAFKSKVCHLAHLLASYAFNKIIVVSLKLYIDQLKVFMCPFLLSEV